MRGNIKNKIVELPFLCKTMQSDFHENPRLTICKIKNLFLCLLISVPSAAIGYLISGILGAIFGLSVGGLFAIALANLTTQLQERT